MANNALVLQKGPTALATLTASEARISREVHKQMERMAEIASVAEAAMDAVSQIASYGPFKAAETLCFVERVRQTMANGSSPEEEAAYQQRKVQYLSDMSHIADSAGGKIVALIEQLSLESQKSILEQLGEVFR
jgi:hypothetical protein